ncbi:MAG: ribonuclease HII [Proteobacteria bacterium]|nr:ribonuclease HII [Pseudomonadota bacterium]
MIVAGVDEAGRGPLAGPVVVAAVVLNPERLIDGLDDSKKLNEKRREELFPLIIERSLAWSVVAIEPAEIDRINILQATLLGMQQAVEQLLPPPSLALIDGNQAPQLDCAVRTIVQGDSLEPAISAASILAKVTRDRLMKKLHIDYPDYGFDRHKGYPTADHLARLARYGPCPIHRRSFAPVRKVTAGGLHTQ